MGTNISDFKVTDKKLLEIYDRLSTEFEAPGVLRLIFNIALSNRSLFPALGVNNLTCEQYVERWIKSYISAEDNPPSQRTATPKTSCSDPAIKIIVQTATRASGARSVQQEKYHNLFMSAENIQGNLLEEYISKNIAPYGWIWCKGNVLRSVDFCTNDGSVLLQIKNKSNSENSSSSAIRIGTAIQKWYRLGTRRKNGCLVPNYKWEELNNIINTNSPVHIGTPCNMSEKSYTEFATGVVRQNPNLITDI
jgi:hypothetical protein